jgi:hypothetical protein
LRKTAAIIVLAALALSAQQLPPAQQYSVDDAFTTSGTEILTLQLPANSNRTFAGFWLNISLNSSAASAKVCFLSGGTKATTTSAAINLLPSATVQPATLAFTASNSSSGTQFGCFTFTGATGFNISNLNMLKAVSQSPSPNGTIQQLGISVTPVTGSITGDIFPLWSEY